jgi:hypothetical protein
VFSTPVALSAAAIIESTNADLGERTSSISSNTAPIFAAISSVPGARYTCVDTVYLIPTAAYTGARTIVSARQPPVEGLDILPPELTLTYAQAVALGKQVTMLFGDDSSEIDLGSAL